MNPIAISIGIQLGSQQGVTTPGADAYLMETGDYYLMETGDQYLLE